MLVGASLHTSPAHRRLHGAELPTSLRGPRTRPAPRRCLQRRFPRWVLDGAPPRGTAPLAHAALVSSAPALASEGRCAGRGRMEQGAPPGEWFPEVRKVGVGSAASTRVLNLTGTAVGKKLRCRACRGKGSLGLVSAGIPTRSPELSPLTYQDNYGESKVQVPGNQTRAFDLFRALRHPLHLLLLYLFIYFLYGMCPYPR